MSGEEIWCWVLPVAEQRVTVRPASLRCSQRMLPLQLRDRGRIWSSDYPEVHVTNRGYVSFVTGVKA